jgi:tetratricopeptide (TPR) repeat protein
VLLTGSVRGQDLLLEKEPIRTKLINCFYHIYNSDTVRFPQAARELKILIPDHPANDLLKSLSIYWAKYPLDLEGDEILKLKTLLKSTIEKCHEILDEDEDDFEVKYVDMIAHAMLALSYNRDHQFFRSASEAKKAYNYFREGFELMNDYNEFYFSSGLYSYYREKYPQIYPIYKTIIWVFKSGDMKEGLRLLRLAVDKTVFARVEAAFYSGHILLRYEMKPEEALPYAQLLGVEYPNNLFFRANYIENLLFLKRYDEAEELLKDFPETDHAYYQVAKSVFKGIIDEQKFEYESAETLYNRALEYSKRGVNEEIDNMKNLANCGLARLSLLVDDEEKAKDYYKSALKDVKFELYQQEPNEFLKLHN